MRASERCFPASLSSHTTPYRSTPKSFWTVTARDDDTIIVITSTASEHSHLCVRRQQLDAKCELHFVGLRCISAAVEVLCASSLDEFFPTRRFAVLQREEEMDALARSLCTAHGG